MVSSWGCTDRDLMILDASLPSARNRAFRVLALRDMSVLGYSSKLSSRSITHKSVIQV